MRKINLAVVAAVSVAILCGSLGCAKPITAKTNQSQAASYDGNARNSGIVGIAPGGGRIVTQHFLDRYNAMVDLYGDQFTPPLKHNDGFNFDGEGTTCIIDKEHFIKMGQMLQWKRDGRKPTGTFQKLINKIT